MDKNQQLNRLFDRARNAEVQYSFEETKSQFLQSMTNPGTSAIGKKSVINLKNGLIMFTIISGIALSLIFFIDNDHQSSNSLNLSYEEKPVINTPESKKSKLDLRETNAFFVPRKQKEKNDFEEKPDDLQQPLTKDSENVNSFIPNYTKPSKKEPLFNSGNGSKGISSDDRFVPKLTDEEIKENNKRKKQMVKALRKPDRKEYAYVPAGTIDYQGKKVSIMGFNIGTKEVSVLEYKTFLWDLIIQGEIAKFHKAKPLFEKWKESGIEDYQYMIDHYFSADEFANHPINNISREGAELYCIWLTQEANKQDGEPMNDLRIPTRAEWYYAASGLGKYRDYPWDGENIINEYGCAMANFNYQSYTEKSKIRCEEKSDVEKAFSTAQYMLGGHEYMAINDSYNVNPLGLFDVCGNVTEMVYDWDYDSGTVDKSKTGTEGGGWMDSADEIKLTAPDKYLGVREAHPNIGFRVVFTHLSNNSIQKIKDNSMTMPEEQKKYNDDSWTLTPHTTLDELREFEAFAKEKGWNFDYRVTTLNNRLYSLTFNMASVENNSDCNDLYFHDGLFIGKKKEVEIHWKEDNSGHIEFDFVFIPK